MRYNEREVMAKETAASGVRARPVPLAPFAPFAPIAPIVTRSTHPQHTTLHSTQPAAVATTQPSAIAAAVAAVATTQPAAVAAGGCAAGGVTVRVPSASQTSDALIHTRCCSDLGARLSPAATRVRKQASERRKRTLPEEASELDLSERTDVQGMHLRAHRTSPTCTIHNLPLRQFCNKCLVRVFLLSSLFSLLSSVHTSYKIPHKASIQRAWHLIRGLICPTVSDGRHQFQLIQYIIILI